MSDIYFTRLGAIGTTLSHVVAVCSVRHLLIWSSLSYRSRFSIWYQWGSRHALHCASTNFGGRSSHIWKFCGSKLSLNSAGGYSYARFDSGTHEPDRQVNGSETLDTLKLLTHAWFRNRYIVSLSLEPLYIQQNPTNRTPRENSSR